ncbi:MAG TPA: vitamin K epoxide reductase family protein [Anaerolineaceae bacterium]|nr:vitamin K epoxide reductase family protein [Anaerolineaceae bacterium]
MKIKKLTIIVAILGFLDAIYLTIIKFTDNKALCLEGVGDCWSVNNSPYSEWNGIPISIFGALAYLVIILILAFQNRFSVLGNFGSIFVLGISLSGFLFSIYLTYLQFAVIKAVCPFCLFSAGTMTIVFILLLINYLQEQSEKDIE